MKSNEILVILPDDETAKRFSDQMSNQGEQFFFDYVDNTIIGKV